MKSRVCVARLLSLLLIAWACLGLGACGTSSNLYVTKDLQEPLDARTATVVTAGNGSKLNKYARKLKEMLAKRLKREGLFDEVGPDGDVMIRATIQNMDDGTQVGRGLSLKGKAEITVEVKISEPGGTTLAHITVSADSAREGDDDRPDLRVVQAAADRIVQYLKEHKGKADKAKAKQAKADKAKADKAKADKAKADKANEDKANEDKANDDKANEDKANDDKANEDKANEDKANED